MDRERELERLYSRKEYLEKSRDIKKDFFLVGGVLSVGYIIVYRTCLDPSFFGDIMSAGGFVLGGVVGSHVNNIRYDLADKIGEKIDELESRMSR